MSKTRALEHVWKRKNTRGPSLRLAKRSTRSLDRLWSCDRLTARHGSKDALLHGFRKDEGVEGVLDGEEEVLAAVELISHG
jgi:hypothetical protein